MTSEQLSPGSGDGASDVHHEGKHSFLNKVKAKAKHLTSKLHHSTEASPRTPTSGDPHGQANAQGPTDQGVDQSDTTASDGVGKSIDTPYTPITNTALPHPTRPPGATVPNLEDSPLGGAASGQTGYGNETPKTSEDKSFPEDPSVLKSEGPAETEQAVPTNYSYFNADPEKACLPSDYDAASQRKEEVPSSLGGESAGITPASATEGDGQSKSRGRDAELPRSLAASQESEQESGVGLVEPSEPSEESLVSHPVEQDHGLESPDSSSDTRNPQNSLQNEEGKGFSGLASGNAPSTDKDFDGTDETAANPDPDYRAGAKYDNSSDETDQEGHHHGLAAAAAGAAGTGAVVAGVHHKFGSSKNQAPVENEDDNSSNLATGDSKQTGSQPADNVNETLETSESGIDGTSKDRSFPSDEGVVGDLGHERGSSKDQAPVQDDNSAKLAAGETGSEVLPTDGSKDDRSFVSKGLGAAAAVAGGGVAAGAYHGFDSNSKDQALKDDTSSKLATADSEETGFQPADNFHERKSETLPTAESGTDGSDKANSFLSTQERDSYQDNSDLAPHSEDQQKPVAGVLTESDYGLRDSPSGMSGSGSNTAASQGQDLNLPTNDGNYGNQEMSESTPISQKPTEGGDYPDSTPFSQEPTDSAFQGGDYESTPLSQKATDSAAQGEDYESTPLSQKATDSAAQGENYESTPISQKATDSAAQGENYESTPISQKATDSAAQGENYESTPISQKATDSAAQGGDYTDEAEKASGATSQAEDTPEKTNLDQQGKASAPSAMSLTGLTGMMKSRFGGSPAASPTSAPAQDSDVPTSAAPSSDASDASQNATIGKDIPSADQKSTPAPGLFNRVTGMASSLFGGSPKPQPGAEGEKTAAEN